MKEKDIISQFSAACISASLVIDGPNILGLQVKQNAINAAKHILAWLDQQTDAEININLAGYSRGAVTCIQIANFLKEYEHQLLRREAPLSQTEASLLLQLHALKIHIFAMDPVAGISAKGHIISRLIPGNVKSYVATFQMDERRRDFKPQDLTRTIITSPETRVSMLPFYGSHSDAVKIRSHKKQSGATLSWYVLHQFLNQHGTVFKDDQIPQIVTNVNNNHVLSDLEPKINSKKMLTLFVKHHQERDDYLTSGATINVADGLPMIRRPRSLNNHLNLYVKSPKFIANECEYQFFVNQLERELFKVSYPLTFNYLFEQNQGDLRFPSGNAARQEDVVKELCELSQENSGLFERLIYLGAVASDKKTGQIILIYKKPHGVYCIESCETLQQLFPTLLTDSIKKYSPNLGPKELAQCAKDLVALPKLEQEVYRLTLRYEREKSEFSPFSKRAQAWRARLIRDEVWHIINTNKEADDRESRRIGVLNVLEKHYEALVKSGNTSALAAMLQYSLAAHGRRYRESEVSLPRELLSVFLHVTLTLLKETISFVGNLGHIGGVILSGIGLWLHDFGRRIHDALGNLGHNPFKYVVAAVAYLFQAIGFVLQNTFGLKPLTNVITEGIRNIRDELNIVIRASTVICLETETSENIIKTAIVEQNQQIDTEDKRDDEEPSLEGRRSSNGRATPVTPHL